MIKGEIVQALHYAFQDSTMHREKIRRENLVSVLNMHQAFLVTVPSATT